MRRKAEDFEPVKTGKIDLGRGSYGSVKLVRDKQNGKEYAMKIVRQSFKHLDE
jgi:serine/threonine protein kinase